MTMIGSKKRVFLRRLRKISQRYTRSCKCARCKVVLREECGVNVLKSRFIRGRYSATPLIFNV